MAGERRTEFSSAVLNGDVETAAEIWKADPELLSGTILSLNDYLKDAVREDHVDMLHLLVDLGADINHPTYDDSPVGVIEEAALSTATSCVDWLLKNGARVNFESDEHGRQCCALESAIMYADLEMVKLFVEHGAWYDYAWKGRSPLSMAQALGKAEVADYLISVGAKLTKEAMAAGTKGSGPRDSENEADDADPLHDHVSIHFGVPEGSEIQQVVSTEPAISIVVVRNDSGVVLVTRGMSESPLAFADGSKVFAELVMQLPADWPIDSETLTDDKYSWPIEWLRRIALYPHLTGEPFGVYVMVPNGSPAEPLSDETEMSTLFAIQAMEDYKTLECDGKTIVFYNVLPVYTEEHNLEQKEGVVALLKAFAAHDVGIPVDLTRPNTALMN